MNKFFLFIVILIKLLFICFLKCILGLTKIINNFLDPTTSHSLSMWQLKPLTLTTPLALGRQQVANYLLTIFWYSDFFPLFRTRFLCMENLTCKSVFFFIATIIIFYHQLIQILTLWNKSKNLHVNDERRLFSDTACKTIHIRIIRS